MFWRAFAKYGPAVLLTLAGAAVIDEYHWIDRTLGAARIFGGAMAAGSLVGLLAAVGLLPFAMHGERRGQRLSYVVGCSVASGALFVLVASVANRIYAPQAPRAEATYRLVSKGYSGRASTPYVVLATQFGAERFFVSGLICEEASGHLRVVSEPGNLGFDRVVHFDVPNPSIERTHNGEAQLRASAPPSAPLRSAHVER